jgi:4-amino-4-deoxy-L-arabinose transferase-like glycosyltransferase
MFEFLGGQVAVFGAAFILYIIILFKKETYRNRTLVLFSLPLLLVGIAISLSSGAQAHWAAATYVAASIIIADNLIRNNRKKWLKVILVSNLVIFVMCLDIRIPASIASIKKDPLHRITMWYRLEEPV